MESMVKLKPHTRQQKTKKTRTKKKNQVLILPLNPEITMGYLPMKARVQIVIFINFVLHVRNHLIKRKIRNKMKKFYIGGPGSTGNGNAGDSSSSSNVVK